MTLPKMPIRLVVLTLVAPMLLGACDSAGTSSAEDSESKRLRTEVNALCKEVNDLSRQGAEDGRALAAEKAATASLREEMAELRKEGKRLAAEAAQAKADYDRLKADAGRRVSPGEGAAASDPKVVGRGPAKLGTPEVRREDLVALESDIKGRIAHTQAAVGSARSKITSLTRATVDAKAQLPPNGMVNKYGQVCRRERRNVGTLKDPVWEHTYVPIGPAVVLGDFRSVQDKNAAINEAKAELAPLLIELRTLETELVKVRADLGEARTDP
jgi:hypothetical protein